MSIFKSHSISITYSLGTQHGAKFESDTNRMTFETNPIALHQVFRPQAVTKGSHRRKEKLTKWHYKTLFRIYDII